MAKAPTATAPSTTVPIAWAPVALAPIARAPTLTAEEGQAFAPRFRDEDFKEHPIIDPFI